MKTCMVTFSTLLVLDFNTISDFIITSCQTKQKLFSSCNTLDGKSNLNQRKDDKKLN